MPKKDEKLEYMLLVLQGKVEKSTYSDDHRSFLNCSIVRPPEYQYDHEKGYSNLRDFTHLYTPTTYFNNLSFNVSIWGDTSSHVEIGYDHHNEAQLLHGERLQYMAKTMKSVTDKMMKIENEFGCKTTGQKLNLFARVLGLKLAVWRRQTSPWIAGDYETLRLDSDFVDRVDRVIASLEEECRLKMGKGTKPVVLITDAPPDYDGSGTREMMKMHLQYRDRQLRRVEVPPDAYLWQMGRYSSGLYLIMTMEEFNRSHHPACHDFKPFTPKPEVEEVPSAS